MKATSCCPCPIEPHAQSSPADAPWRTCDCRCHDSAKQMVLRDGPEPRYRDMTEDELVRAWSRKETT